MSATIYSFAVLTDVVLLGLGRNIYKSIENWLDPRNILKIKCVFRFGLNPESIFIHGSGHVRCSKRKTEDRNKHWAFESPKRLFMS